MQRLAERPLHTICAPAPNSADDALVVGLGNILLADDGVGIHAVRRLAVDPQATAILGALDGGTLGFRLLQAVTQSAAVLFIDAAELDQPPGTIRLLEHDALDVYIRRAGRMSAHQAGLVDLLTLARIDGWAPAHLAVLGIQPERIDWDENLSETVARMVPPACRMAIDIVQRWMFTP